VLEREGGVIPIHTMEKKSSLHDIVVVPLKSTRMGKLISRFHLIH
jgi:hypothetical protein